MKLTRKNLKSLVESFISGPEGTMYVPDKDPYMSLDPMIQDKFAKDEILSDKETANQAASFDSMINPDKLPLTGTELSSNVKVYDNPAMSYDIKAYKNFITNVYFPELEKLTDAFDQVQEEISRYPEGHPKVKELYEKDAELYRHEINLIDKKHEMEDNLKNLYGKLFSTGAELRQAKSDYTSKKDINK